MTASAGAEQLLGFARALRASGVPIAIDQVERFAQALSLIRPVSRARIYWAARATLITRSRDLERLDELFARLYGARLRADRRPGAPAPSDRARDASRRKQAPPARRPHSGSAEMSASAETTALLRWAHTSPVRAEREVDAPDRRGAFSSLESLRHKDFAELTQEEHRVLARLLETLDCAAFTRRTRRFVARSHGRRIDLRRTLRSAARHGGALLRLERREPKVSPRPLVLIADVSGSMETYTHTVLQLFHTLARRIQRVESFVFGTRLSRITHELAVRNVDEALAAVGAEVSDFAGGTRIAECLSVFNRLWSPRVLARGSVVVIVSDGWEPGTAAPLAREMRFLRDRCQRLIWLNPLLGADSYEPRVAGMRAALPFVDDFLPAHNLASMESLAQLLARLPKRRTSLRSTRGTH